MSTQYFINFVARKTLSNFNQSTLAIYVFTKEILSLVPPKEPLKFV